MKPIRQSPEPPLEWPPRVTTCAFHLRTHWPTESHDALWPKPFAIESLSIMSTLILRRGARCGMRSFGSSSKWTLSRHSSTLQALAAPRSALAAYRCRTALVTAMPRSGQLTTADAFTSAKATLSLAVIKRNAATKALDPSTANNSPDRTDPIANGPVYKPPTKGFLSKLPASWVPYAELMRVEQTGGLYAFYSSNLIGMAWAACIAVPAPEPSQILYVAGATLAYIVWYRGAACIVNDIWDVEFDRKVARCRTRPMARGAVTAPQAWVWYGTNVAVMSALIAALMPHPLACFYNAAPALFLLSVYPLCKRYTDFPQLVLCVPVASGLFVSCAALGVDPWTVQDGAHAAATVCMVTSLMAYFTALDYVNACQDTADDIKAGVRSMAVRFRDQRVVLGTLATIQVSLMVTAGVLADLSPTFFIAACGGVAAIMARQASTINRARPDLCKWWFKRGSLLFGGTTTFALFLEYYWRTRSDSKNEEEQLKQL